MAIDATLLKLYKTTNNLGGAVTATELNTANLFDDFTDLETVPGTTVYACVYFVNENAELARVARLFNNAETVHAGVNATFGLGTSPINGVEQVIVDETTAPVGVTFVEALDIDNALQLGDLPAGQHRAFWIRLAIDPGVAAKNNYTLGFQKVSATGE